jgi:arsenate reductase-like glutaredoxin family protein
MKGKLQQAVETNAAQTKHLESCATRDELAKAIKRSDEMLEIMRKRVDEDRTLGEGRYKELYGIISGHVERIGKLEVSQDQLFKLLDKLESTVTSGFREMKADMKELRDALKRG